MTDEDRIDYQKVVEDALRGAVRRVLAVAAARGLPGKHHFYLAFRTSHPGVQIPSALRDLHPEEMTIVLENQYWNLEVEDDRFSVELSFGGTRRTLTVPFAALTAFADPSAEFGLRFQGAAAAAERPAGLPRPARGGQPKAAAGGSPGAPRVSRALRGDGPSAASLGAESAAANEERPEPAAGPRRTRRRLEPGRREGAQPPGDAERSGSSGAERPVGPARLRPPAAELPGAPAAAGAPAPADRIARPKRLGVPQPRPRRPPTLARDLPPSGSAPPKPPADRQRAPDGPRSQPGEVIPFDPTRRK
ncbi:MAG TPA: ClpXP protease specificity-enhancing factor SspB [Thermoanaerobaculia bacterium]|nr:ClpXP protease specificity-enhancing factor SspB [Thermoanaerobaculia bacterium]